MASDIKIGAIAVQEEVLKNLIFTKFRRVGVRSLYAPSNNFQWNINSSFFIMPFEYGQKFVSIHYPSAPVPSHRWVYAWLVNVIVLRRFECVRIFESFQSISGPVPHHAKMVEIIFI